jgi:hypothetical protein
MHALDMPRSGVEIGVLQHQSLLLKTVAIHRRDLALTKPHCEFFAINKISEYMIIISWLGSCHIVPFVEWIRRASPVFNRFFLGRW